MKQIGRNLTDCLDGFLIGYHYLIHVRSALFTREFKEILESAGVKTVRLPARSPNLNSFAERFVRSIIGECLDRMILIGERSLRRAVEQSTSSAGPTITKEITKGEATKSLNWISDRIEQVR